MSNISVLIIESIIMFDDNNPWNLGKKPVGSKTPNSEDILSKAMSDIRCFFTGLTRNRGKKPYFIVFIILLLYACTGFYIVHPSEESIELTFGKYSNTETPGLRYHFPYPIGKVFKVNVKEVNREEIGVSSSYGRDTDRGEGVMLTGDENIVNVNFEVQWRVRDAKDYLFKVRDYKPGFSVKNAAESTMREIIGKNTISFALSHQGRVEISRDTRTLLQQILDGYQMGIEILSVQMKKIDPPEKVISSFRDVQNAIADKERTINEAYAYRNDIIPRAKGEAIKIKLDAEAYENGNPFGLGGSVSTGIISARSRDISIGTMNEFIQTDAAINRGNSGGPLFDLNGKVIGINTAIYSPSESGGNVGIGFAIPSNLAMSIIDALKSGKKIKHGWLGVQVQPITKEFAESLGLKDTKGALVASIVKDSPAEKGGIKVGDILLEFDDKKIDRMTQLPQMVSRTEPGKKVQIKLLRKGKEVNIKVVIEESANDGQGNNQEENKSTSDYITGLTVSNLPKESKESNPTKGVIVTNVDSNSNATLRGIKKGDIIIQLDGTDIKNTNDFQKQVDSAVKKNGKDSIMLLIYRNGNQFFTSVKLKK